MLAAEVRAPGTFSQKVLRAVDELDPDTAALFERVASHRMQEAIPIGVMGELNFTEKVQLIEAGLLVDPGLGNQIRLSQELTHNGVVWLFLAFGTRAIAISAEREVTAAGKFLTTDGQGKPAVPIYLLTKTGAAIASILPQDERPTFDSLERGILSEVTKGTVRTYVLVGETQWSLTSEQSKPTPTYNFSGPSDFGGFAPPKT